MRRKKNKGVKFKKIRERKKEWVREGGGD